MRYLRSIVYGMALSQAAGAATEGLIWGQLEQTSPYAKVLSQSPGSRLSAYQLTKIQSPDPIQDHQRYQVKYQGLPVLGYQMIVHQPKGQKEFITGLQITGIEQDIPDVQASFSPQEAVNKLQTTLNIRFNFHQETKVIYIDDNTQAHLAYHVQYSGQNGQQPIFASAIVDAHSGQMIDHWSELESIRVGQGLGGTTLNLPYRAGIFQHGNVQPDMRSLARFDVQVKKGNCIVQSPNIRVIDADHYSLKESNFPMSNLVENLRGIKAYSYPCSLETGYYHKMERESGPVNGSYSPINDAMYFSEATLDMYRLIYGVEKPLGKDLPLRVYTHVPTLDNAFAIKTVKHFGLTFVHQQIVIGEGSKRFTSPVQAILGHELSHAFTRNHSNITPKKEGEALSESFSDMAAIALMEYLSASKTWYWNRKDWVIGRESTLSGRPLRYMEHPSYDGHSVEHYKNYNAKLDGHLAAGISNRAFYLLAHKPGWSIRKAFQVMVDANRHYWTPKTNFETAACGAIQAAKDRNYEAADVFSAFDEVGVVCSIVI